MSMLKYIYILVFFAFLLSCGDDKNSFTEEELKTVDSIFIIRKKELTPVLDSLCDSIYKKEFELMVDSIKEVRKKEILDLIKD